MKSLFTVLLVLSPFLLGAQNADSLAVVRLVDSLLKIARGYIGTNDFDQAIEVNVVAEKIALSRGLGMGRESVAYANCCHTHGLVMYYKADYREAEKWWLEAKAIRETLLGKEHPAYEKTLTNLAILYTDMGK